MTVLTKPGRTLLRTALAITFAASLIRSGDALADPSPQDKALAKADWTRGRQAMAVKNFTDAAEAFKSADGRDPKAQYKLDLARALSEIGKLVEAEELLEAIPKLTEPNAEKEKLAAKQLSDKLVPRIPTLKIVVSGPADDAVSATIDGSPIPVGEDVRRDPGDYMIKATAEKFEPTERHVTLAEGERFDVKLTFKPSTDAGKSDTDKPSTGGTMLPAAIAFGVGGAGILLGTVFGILAFTTTDQIAAACKGNVCPPGDLDAITTDLAYGNASTALFVIGGAGVATGIILALTVGRGSKTEEKKPEKAFVMPYVTPFGAGIVGSF